MDTNSKIREIAEKIRHEGVEKANREAENILETARKKAEEILQDATKKAEEIINQANHEAMETARRITSEVRISAQQALLNLKREICELIQTTILKEPLNKVFNDREFVRSLLETMVRNWDPSTDDTSLQVLLPEDKLKEVETYFREKTSSLLNKGLSLQVYNGSGKGFEIQPENGHYKINITDESFELYLKEHFRPYTMEFLFGGKS
jgi:V/A-type H+/Na+-transporting ATPase subunit E